MSFNPGSPKSRRTSFLDIGGPNSLNNFANSYTRAQSYIGSTLLEQSPSLLVSDDVSPNTSPYLEGQDEGEITIDYRLDDNQPIPQGYNHIRTFHFPEQEIPPSEVSPLIRRRSSLAISIKSGEATLISGNSTVPQTVFNSVNTLMGIAMLSLPYAFKVSGWILGSIIFLISAIITNKTAKLLGKILAKHPELNTYGDIAFIFGGKSVAVVVTIIFLIDMIGAMLSLILLFTDSFSILLPQISKSALKAIVVSVLFILSLFPLSILSMLSLLGITCTLTVIIIVIICGLSITQSPGSLWDPVPTSLWPLRYDYLILSLGLFMAPWGGHPVFPELYRDMRHPIKYNKSTNISFTTSFLLELGLSIIGLIMYGSQCQDSIIKNLMLNNQYPKWINPTLSFLMGFLSLSKLPLVAKPIITVYENLLGINDDLLLIKQSDGELITGIPSHVTRSNASIIMFRRISRIFSRIIFCIGLLVVSLAFSTFGKVVSFLGAAICFTICMTLPLMFYLKLFYYELTTLQRLLFMVGILIGISSSIMGTYAAITLDINI
ncbi:transmembrane amino acid transporter protein-domain-containing protein [Scheffersomyces amazonensis]|uniref:transmembrane amino acid transporter protein-domain-containing protein n=1 Tax=Scheffersomyces amazonensis TaxID=1078765 RepID=UPI00315C9307